MSKSIRFGAALAFLVVAGGISAADEARGVIEKVDPAKDEVVVDLRSRAGRGLSITLHLTKDTRIQVGREAATPADLQPGARVHVLYETRNGQRVAVEVSARGGRKRPAPARAEENTVTGMIGRVSPAQRELVVAGPAGQGEKPTETTLVVAENARILKEGKPAKLDDLKEGDPVVVRTDRQDGRLAAVAVEVKTPVDMAKRIEQIRQVLRVADFVLQQLANQKK